MAGHHRRYVCKAGCFGQSPERRLQQAQRAQGLAALSDDVIGPDLIRTVGRAGEVDLAREVEGLVGLPLREVERRLILATLERAGGNKKEAAEELGISRRSLYDRLSRYAEDK